GPAPHAPGGPGGRVPARIPVRPARLESAGRQPDHLRRVRPVPQRPSPRGGRLRRHEHRRGPGPRGAAAPLPAEPQGPLRDPVHSRPRGLDRGARESAGARPAARAVAARPGGRHVAVPGDAVHPRYGRVGLIAVPFYTFGEMLAPLVEVFGYGITIAGLALGVVNVSFALLFILVAWGYGMLLSLWAVVLEEVSFHRYRRFGDLVRLVLFATLENFGYHQCGVWWRLRAFFTLGGRKHVWGEMTRRGFETATK